jgi:SAM-dependent methyltransferase
MSDIGIETVNCPACGPTDSSVWMKDGRSTRYIRCKSCGTIFASPRSNWASRFSWLDENFCYGDKAISNASGRQEGLRFEAEIIKKNRSSGTLLDIGCDLGDFFACFNPSEWERHGIEVSPSAAEYVRQQYPVDVFTGLLNQTNFKDNCFDVVTMLDTLYYVDHPQADFEEIFRILKPGGLLAVEITGLNYQMLRSRGLVCWVIDRQWTRLQTDSSYINWFSPKGLEILFTKTGFIIDRVIPIPSPSVSRNSIYRYASKIYYHQFKLWGKSSYSWAPKYMVLGKKP